MAKNTEPTAANTLRQMLDDVQTTSAALDALETELSECRAALQTAQSLNESDSLISRIESLQASIPAAELRASLAAKLLNERGGALQREALADAMKAAASRFCPKEREIDSAIVKAAKTLLQLFEQRQALESETHNFVYENTPALLQNGISGDIRATATPLMPKGAHIFKITNALFGIEEYFKH